MSKFQVELHDGTIALGTPSEFWAIAAYCYLLGGKVKEAIMSGQLDIAGEVAQEHLTELAGELYPKAQAEVATLLEKKNKEFLAEIEAEIGEPIPTTPVEDSEGGEPKKRSKKKAPVNSAARDKAIETLTERKAKMLAFEKVVRLLIGRCMTGSGCHALRKEVLTALGNVYGDSLPEEQFSESENRFCPRKLMDLVSLLVQAIAQGFDTEQLLAEADGVEG